MAGTFRQSKIQLTALWTRRPSACWRRIFTVSKPMGTNWPRAIRSSRSSILQPAGMASPSSPAPQSYANWPRENWWCFPWTQRSLQCALSHPGRPAAIAGSSGRSAKKFNARYKGFSRQPERARYLCPNLTALSLRASNWQQKPFRKALAFNRRHRCHTPYHYRLGMPFWRIRRFCAAMRNGAFGAP